MCLRVSWFVKASRCPWTHPLVQVQRLQVKTKITVLVFNDSPGVDGPGPGPHSHWRWEEASCEPTFCPITHRWWVFHWDKTRSMIITQSHIARMTSSTPDRSAFPSLLKRVSNSLHEGNFQRTPIAANATADPPSAALPLTSESRYPAFSGRHRRHV